MGERAAAVGDQRSGDGEQDRPRRREVDRDGAVAYLESSNPLNIPLYERFGFEVIAEIQAGDSPTIWPMLRPATRST